MRAANGGLAPGVLGRWTAGAGLVFRKSRSAGEAARPGPCEDRPRGPGPRGRVWGPGRWPKLRVCDSPTWGIPDGSGSLAETGGRPGGVGQDRKSSHPGRAPAAGDWGLAPLTPPLRCTAERKSAFSRAPCPQGLLARGAADAGDRGQGGAFLPRGRTRSAVPAALGTGHGLEKGKLCLTWLEAPGVSQDWEGGRLRPRPPRPRRRPPHSSWLPGCRSGPSEVACRRLGLVAMLESSPREVSRLSPLVLYTFGCVCEYYGSAKTCGGPGLPALPWRALSGAFPRWPDAGPNRPARTREVVPRARRHPVGAPSAAFPDPASRGTDEWASFFLFFNIFYLLQ